MTTAHLHQSCPVAKAMPPRARECPTMPELQSRDGCRKPEPAPGQKGALLLVEASPSARLGLRRVLAAKGFAVTAVHGAGPAEIAAARTAFAYAVVSLQLGAGCSLALVRRLREAHAAMRIVVITDVDSFASAVLALRVGADDYLAKPVADSDLIDALLDRVAILPSVPETPLALSRIRWEHVMRIYEQCGRNVTKTARHLGMHRRSLQRILSKRAPQPRRMPLP